MSISSTLTRVARLALPLALITATVLLISAPRPAFTPREKAYYANAAVVNFVRPGLALKSCFPVSQLHKVVAGRECVGG